MEVAYVPCIAYPSGEMKHGPIVVRKIFGRNCAGRPPKDKTLSTFRNAEQEAFALPLFILRGPIASEGDISIIIPRCSEMFSPLPSVFPSTIGVQQVAMGCDIDRPSNQLNPSLLRNYPFKTLGTTMFSFDSAYCICCKAHSKEDLCHRHSGCYR